MEVIGRHGCESEVNNLPNGHKYYCRSVLLSTNVMSTPNKYYLLPAKLCCCSEHRDSCFNVDESTLPDGADKNVTITDIEMCFCSTDRCSHNPCKHQSSPLSACKYASSSQISTRSDMMSPCLIGPIYREVCRTFDSLTWSHISDLWLYKGTKYSFLSAVCCFLLVWRHNANVVLQVQHGGPPAARAHRPARGRSWRHRGLGSWHHLLPPRRGLGLNFNKV